MDELTKHAQEIIRISAQLEKKTVPPRFSIEEELERWGTMLLPVSDQNTMRNICVRVKPVLLEMIRRSREQQTRIDALEVLVMNMVTKETKT